MDEKILDNLFDKLIAAHHQKTQRLLIKAKAEYDTIQREDAAYYDGVSDTINQLRQELKAKTEDGADE